MLHYALKRAMLTLLVALTVSLVCFLLVNLSTDVASAMAGDGATAKIHMGRIAIDSEQLWPSPSMHRG